MRLGQRHDSSKLLHPPVESAGLSCHWDGPGSTSAMWRTADDGGIEQLDGSFLHSRTHTPDPKATVRSSFSAPQSGQSAAAHSARHRGQRVGVAGQKPAAVGLFAVYGDPMTGQLRCFSAGARCYR
jgi:hypothetical protein